MVLVLHRSKRTAPTLSFVINKSAQHHPKQQWTYKSSCGNQVARTPFTKSTSDRDSYSKGTFTHIMNVHAHWKIVPSQWADSVLHRAHTTVSGSHNASRTSVNVPLNHFVAVFLPLHFTLYTQWTTSFGCLKKRETTLLSCLLGRGYRLSNNTGRVRTLRVNDSEP